MTIAYGIIQTALNPAATTETEWIVCPAATEYIGTVRICNVDTVAITYRLAHTPATGAASSEDWDIYDTELEPGEVDDITMEMKVAETLRVYASTANVSFKYSGQVIT
jgi:hypothetical protein